jgi:hypothetical protein
MPKETARQYARVAESVASMIWSVNNESNPFAVRDLFSESLLKRVVRSPYWMRDGYVDEFIPTGSHHELASALPKPPRLGAPPLNRALHRLEQLKRQITSWNPVKRMIRGRR